ncbi:aldehyde dehydrogenase family protein [Bacillus sp. FJAT-44742]|uniref:aldehyde dehydrogenase family protein n=1 Tax=Bacillus sp. FJAT-44742 TaxID=2014005 RepID=UPI000C245624|nr:aldehyde dehydrogenase family protein [Bacillus sp. FJAT-44742]
MKQAHIWINNEERKKDNYQSVTDPGDFRRTVGQVAVGEVSDVEDCVQSAHDAFKTWKGVSLDQRISFLQKGASSLTKDLDELAELVSSENGMQISTTKAELLLALDGIQNLIELARDYFTTPLIEDEESWVKVEKDPKGVIAGIVPWNAPIVLTMQKLVPAVLSGNTIVFKPSPFASLGTYEVIKRMAAPLPPGVINIIHGDGKVGSALTSHPHVRMVSFTGGGETAKHIMRGAADSLKNLHFELGGNDAAILLEDADIEETAAAVIQSSFRKAGQYCFATKRVYVPHSIYDSFFHEIVNHLKEVEVGHQLNESATFGPMNNKQQFEHVKTLIQEAKAQGAEVITEGKKLQPELWEHGYYLLPTVVKDISFDHRLVKEEQFGPILPIVPYNDLEEAIEMANSTEFGLGSSVWTNNEELGKDVAKQLQAGFTFINGIAQSRLGYKHMPFGGVKQSGMGRENSELVFEEYIDHHAIHFHKERK